MLKLPFFDAVEPAQRVLLAGAGGGFDIYCGLPLFFALRSAGKEVHLANLSFADIKSSTGRGVSSGCVQVTADVVGNERYFPELHLCRWLRGQGLEAPIYAFDNEGVQPLREAYETLVEQLNIDAVILIDGGTDSLMRGDEYGLGTPVEDVASLLAIEHLEVATKLLVCVGFGVDAFHGVCHAQFLEAVAELTRSGAYLGAWSLTPQMPEVELYRAAAEFVFRRMPHHPSIVSSSILAAVEGQFGDYHSTHRTQGSKLFINPLMGFLWAFQAQAVIDRLLYPAEIRSTWTGGALAGVIEQFRLEHRAKAFEPLPM